MAMSEPYVPEQYELKGTFTGILIQLAAIMRKDGLGQYKITCHDGSTVDIRIAATPPKRKKKVTRA